MPESVYSETGWVLDYHPIEPDWRSPKPNCHEFTWRTDDAYLALQDREKAANPHQSHKEFVKGMAVETRLEASIAEVAVRLTLRNEGTVPFRRVFCDGGCLQAMSPEFAGSDEVSRTHLMVGGRMTPLSELPRAVDIRCTYHCDPRDYDRPPTDDGEWFWGRSGAAPDSPAIIGMVAKPGDRAVVIGYEGASAASANADIHHCIHSRPAFGDIGPGQAVTRQGWIHFGSDIHELGARLLARIRNGEPVE